MQRLHHWSIFFEEIVGDEEQTVTVNTNRYLNVLQIYVIPRLQMRGILDEVTFMQDGAPPHIGKAVRDFLTTTFHDRVISRYMPHAWPPRSPDLTPLDFWFWGHIKSLVYRQKSHTLHELKLAIENAIQSLPIEHVHAAINHVVKRMQKTVDAQGGHIEHLQD